MYGSCGSIPCLVNAPAVPEDAVAGSLLGAQHVHGQVADHAGSVVQDEEHVVVHLFVRATHLQFREPHAGRTEQQQRLVDQVRAEVEKHSAAVRGSGVRLPGLGDLRGPAFKTGLKTGDRAQRLPGQQLLHSEEVAVPAPVLEDRQHAAQPLCEADQFLPFGAPDGERLVHHHVEPGFQGCLGQRVMRCRGGPQHHEVKVGRPREGCFAVGHGLDTRVPLYGGRLPRRRRTWQRRPGSSGGQPRSAAHGKRSLKVHSRRRRCGWCVQLQSRS